MSATRPCYNKKFYIYSDGTHTHLKDRMSHGVLIGPSNKFCLSCQFYDIWNWNPRKALRRVTELLVRKLDCMTYNNSCLGFSAWPLAIPENQDENGKELQVRHWTSPVISVSHATLFVGLVLAWDNQPPCYCETRSEGINYFKQPLETGCDPTHTHTLDKNGSVYDPAGTESWNMQVRYETTK